MFGEFVFVPVVFSINQYLHNKLALYEKYLLKMENYKTKLSY